MELNTLESFFRGDYMPHGHCYLWQPHILWTNVVSDFFIAVAYFSLPIAIMIFSKRRQDIGYNSIFVLFSMFILFCGITHVIGIFTIWHGVYGIHGVSKALTAFVSVLTAIYVYKLLPTAVTLPTISQLKDVEGQLDIAVKKKSVLEAELEDKNLLNFVLNSMSIGTLLIDQSNKLAFCNQKFKSDFEAVESKVGEVLALEQFLILCEKDKTNLTQFLSAAIDGSISFEAFSLDTNEPYEVFVEKSMYGAQEVTLVTLKNLSEVAKIKTELSESHQRLNRAISATEDGIWEWNIETDEVEYSPKLMEIIGKSEIEEPTFQDWFSHIHDDFKIKVQTAIERHFETKEKYIVEYLGEDEKGEFSWFAAIGDTLFEGGEPKLMSGSLRNIELSKRLEKANRENLDFINAIYDGSSQAIWVLNVENDGDFRFEQYNNAACEWTGVTREQIVSKKLSEIAVMSEDLKQQLRQNYTRCVVTDKKVDYVEELPFGENVSWYKTTLYPIRDMNGKVHKIVGTAIDITNEQVLLRRLKESNEYLERFAFVASHDLQEPLRKILAFSDLLKDRLEQFIETDKDISYEFSRIESAANRMRVMIDDILKLSRINTASVNLKKCKLQDIVSEVEDNLCHLLSDRKVVFSIESGHKYFWADPDLTVLLLQNLVTNAIKFSKKGESPNVTISLTQDNGATTISCSDDGIGISGDFLKQIFEPFRRLHSINQYEGSGIGLALCEQIMKVHDGKIWCESEVDKGSKFFMYFPKVKGMH